MSAEKLQSNSDNSIDFREVVNSLVDGLLVTDGEGVILFVNPAYCRGLGVEPEELLGHSVIDIAKEGSLFRHSVCADVIRSHRRVSGAGYLRTLNGKRINGYATGVPIFDENGTLRLVVSSMTDIDELRTRFEQFRGTDRMEDAIQIFDRFMPEDDTLPARDPAAGALWKRAEELGKTGRPLLITGEGGTGKEVLADHIVGTSGRSGGTYIKLNCASIPHNQLLSELFGDPESGKLSLLEQARGGTILIGEIGCLPEDVRQALFACIRGGKTDEVHLLAATGDEQPPQELLDFFGEDRLETLPLRERREDILPLARFFFAAFCAKHGRELKLPESAEAALEGYDWPGNVRELKNVIEYLVISSESGELDTETLAELLDVPASGREDRPGLHESVAQYEKQMIEQALKACGGVRRAAAFLKVDPSTISRKAKKYGIPLADQQP